jgi:hypothetical protein
MRANDEIGNAGLHQVEKELDRLRIGMENEPN